MLENSLLPEDTTELSLCLQHTNFSVYSTENSQNIYLVMQHIIKYIKIFK